MFRSHTTTLTRRIAVLFLAAVFLGAGFAFVASGSRTLASAANDDECGDGCQEQLSAAREATAQYHQESVAIGDGFIADQECVQQPGLGAMGVHHFMPSRMNDTLVNPSEPELLLYEPQANGGMRLVGVEYFAPVIVNGQPWFGSGPPPAGQYNPAPILFGHRFNGPMPGHNPSMPWHYDLHVWAWRHNPMGLFTLFNPKVRCL